MQSNETPQLMPQPTINYTWDAVSLTQVAYYGQETGATLPAQPFHNLAINLSGDPTLLASRVNGPLRREIVQRGALFIVPSDMESYWEAKGPGQSVVLDIDFLPSLWDSAALSMSLDPQRAQLTDVFNATDPLIEQIGRTLFNEAKLGGMGGQLYRDALMQTLLLHLLQNYSMCQLAPVVVESGLSQQALAIVIDYIQTNLNDDLSLQALADQVFLSPYYFARQFKASTGQSPHQYVIAQRVERAKQLIRAKNLPLAAVAAEVGFANQSHLNRHFKRLVGVTPSQFQ